MKAKNKLFLNLLLIFLLPSIAFAVITGVTNPLTFRDCREMRDLELVDLIMEQLLPCYQIVEANYEDCVFFFDDENHCQPVYFQEFMECLADWMEERAQIDARYEECVKNVRDQQPPPIPQPLPQPQAPPPPADK